MAKVGRPRAIDTPETLYQHFLDYKKKVKSEPILVHDFVGKDGNSVYRERENPLIFEGFECYMFEIGVINDLGDYFANTEGRYSEFTTICRTIKREIRSDQIRGGLAGIYNPSITQRLNGLVDKSEQRQIVEQHLFDDSEES